MHIFNDDYDVVDDDYDEMMTTACFC